MSEHPTSDQPEVPLQRPEDDEFYNGSAVEVMTVPAGTTLWRFVELDPPYDVSTFNPNISVHHEHPTGAELGQQGRFDPLDHAHGGYVYCSPTLGGAVAEGILRAKKIPPAASFPPSRSTDEHWCDGNCTSTSTSPPCATHICGKSD
ncbi:MULTISPECIES: hypothetical protein [unclassified Rhodococcus (in: high G+C Gram-positive bacteria)]|uniref:hypothetical protein n=1 Tax=unclassified Rhodococcus (in: high G+C Gram-positive bacteria) TaxID=192944 RepID=UPI00233F1530|nr:MULTISPECIES: hypothetical protein [unclassified Rhodococcus (in: high G+C Gram-positive bacteria)]MDC3729126.1 hypothetical protein [Rhodococcus sp. Rp3]WSE25664.1 hypothetical protein U9J23_26615 [Rhodococcus sp. PD04]